MDEEKVFTVWWDGMLIVSEGDEIEIIRVRAPISTGHLHEQIRASEIKNYSNGRNDTSALGGGSIISPPIRGFVTNINARGQNRITTFELVQGLGPLEVSLRRLTSEASNFFEPEIAKRCITKTDSEDTLLCAFKVLEEKIRDKTGANQSIVGVALASLVHPKNGVITFGETESEKEGFYFLLRGIFQLLRNPPAHRFMDTFDKSSTFEILCTIDLLIKIIDKCKRACDDTPNELNNR